MRKRTIFAVISLTLCVMAGCGQGAAGQGSAPETESIPSAAEGTDGLSGEEQNIEEASALPSTEAGAIENTETVDAGQEMETMAETGDADGLTEKREYTPEEYAAAGVNELNSVPILMYHSIFDLTNAETEYTGGNVDKEGYNRTAEAFAADLEMYYQSGYRCIRLTDFLDGNIDVPFGYKPLILTFDDGRREAEIQGFAEDGTPIFLPHSAIGIMEAFKEAHPDFQLTATFFLNQALFGEDMSYEDGVRIVKWAVENGYDVGNHTLDHPKLPECSREEITRQVGGMYRILEDVIPGQYVNIVALPYGMPTEMNSDPKYEAILRGEYEGFPYETKATLLCGYTRQNSPFTEGWDPTHLFRIRAYDNDGEEFDIKMCFEQLNDGKAYISDGDPNTVVIRAEEEEGWFKDAGGRTVIRY